MCVFVRIKRCESASVEASPYVGLSGGHTGVIWGLYKGCVALYRDSGKKMKATI